jgi:hypothetical protein
VYAEADQDEKLTRLMKSGETLLAQ